MHTQVNRTFESLIEVGARVDAQDVGESGSRHINSAFCLFMLKGGVPSTVVCHTDEVGVWSRMLQVIGEIL